MNGVDGDGNNGKDGDGNHHNHNFQLFVAGEHCDYDTRLWAQKVFKTPVLDNWWQVKLVILIIMMITSILIMIVI